MRNLLKPLLLQSFRTEAYIYLLLRSHLRSVQPPLLSLAMTKLKMR